MTCYVVGVWNSRSWHTMSYVWPTIFRPWPDRNKFDSSLVYPSRTWKQVQVQVQDSGWAWPSGLGRYPSRISSSIMAYWASGRISSEFIFELQPCPDTSDSTGLIESWRKQESCVLSWWSHLVPFWVTAMAVTAPVTHKQSGFACSAYCNHHDCILCILSILFCIFCILLAWCDQYSNSHQAMHLLWSCLNCILDM